MLWWADAAKKEALELSTKDALDPEPVMREFRGWLEYLEQMKWNGCSLEFLAKPATFDHGFVQYYLYRFTGGSPFKKGRAWCVHNLISAITGIPVTDAKIEHLPPELLEGIDRGVAHTGLDDAIYTGKVALRCFQYLERMREAMQDRIKIEAGFDYKGGGSIDALAGGTTL
jgi:hypothetical protein